MIIEGIINALLWIIIIAIVVVVAPAEYIDLRKDTGNTIESNFIDSRTRFERVEGGRNLNVLKVNNISWDILLEMVVMTNRQEYVNGSITVRGVSSNNSFLEINRKSSLNLLKNKSSDKHTHSKLIHRLYSFVGIKIIQ